MSYALATFAAALYVAGYPAGLGLWPLSCVALAPLLYAVQRCALSDRRALATGFGFGLVCQLAGYAFVPYTLEQFSGMPVVLCWLAFVLLCAAQSSTSALFVWLLARARRRGLSALWLAPALWPLIERYAPAIFPSPLGAALHAAPVLIQGAELGGVALVSMWAVAMSCVVAGACDARVRGAHARALALSASGLLAIAGASALRMADVERAQASAPQLRVALVQPSLRPELKRRDPHAFTAAHSALARTAPHDTQLVVWPETAVADPIARAASTHAQLIAKQRAPTLFGALTFGNGALYNSALLVGPSGHEQPNARGRADKHELVPFSEYLPLGERFPVLYDWLAGAGRLTPGSGEVTLALGATRIAALICYEDMLAPYVRDVVRRERPALLVSLSNDAWFSPEGAINRAARTHFAVARLRAVEHRKALVRATNTGVSAFVDPSGHARTAPEERALLLAHDVPLMRGETFYARYGDAALLVLAALLALASAHALTAGPESRKARAA